MIDIRALTVRQPYAAAIMAGVKPVENRIWKRELPPGGLWIGIHAGLRSVKVDVGLVADMTICGGWVKPMPPIVEMPFGALLGLAHVSEICAPEDLPLWIADDPHFQWWASGPWCWVVDQVAPLAEPIPMRGALGLWRVPMELLDDAALEVLRGVTAG